jgi:apyrase
MKRLLITTCLFLSLFISSLVSAAPHYAIIIDGGSTGSRLHLFRYETSQSLPDIQDIFSASTKPGLSAFANNPHDAGSSLKELLDQASLKLQEAHIDNRSVSISVLATAGMRLLPTSKQEAIYNNVREYLRNYGFKVAEIKTISGKMEGVYGWLDINYLLKAFNGKADTTKGNIDMGGASTQIVFSTHGTPIKKSQDIISLRINHHIYNIYSKSFLGLGLTQALNHINKDDSAEFCYPANYHYSSSDLGRFNFNACNSLYNKLIKHHLSAQQGPLIASTNFIAHSGAYYTLSFFEPNKINSQTKLVNDIQNTCNKKWDIMKKEHTYIPSSELASYCANGVYLSSLLYSRYKLQDSQLEVTNQINNKNIDWTLGALLYRFIV